MRLGLFLATSSVALVAGGSAAAAPMDPAPERLVLQPPNLPMGQSCQSIAANPEAGLPIPNVYSCRPDNIAWRNMMSELGFAVAPTAFHPARTTGIGGFSLTFEAAFTHINADQFSTASDGTRRQYWHDGTQGAIDPSKNQFSVKNDSPDGILQLYSIKARKGLPLGFEVTGSLGTLANTTLWVGGADIRWALLEGFRTGFLGYLPDVSIGSGVRTVSGSSSFFLTTVGIDAEISKPIALADSAVLTPYVGYQRLIIFADSTIVSATPNVDPLAQCGYQGNDPQTGAPICKNKLSNGADNNGAFNNNITFEKARIHRNRGLVGLNYRYEVLYLAGQFIMDITDPASENFSIFGDKQWTMVLEAGVFF